MWTSRLQGVAVRTQEVVHLKCLEHRRGLRSHRPWPCQASDGCRHLSQGTFSLHPMPICMPSCQPWQVSQARLASCPPPPVRDRAPLWGATLVRLGRGSSPGWALPGWDWGKAGTRTRAARLSEGSRGLEKGAKPPCPHFSSSLPPSLKKVFNKQTNI